AAGVPGRHAPAAGAAGQPPAAARGRRAGRLGGGRAAPGVRAGLAAVAVLPARALTSGRLRLGAGAKPQAARRYTRRFEMAEEEKTPAAPVAPPQAPLDFRDLVSSYTNRSQVPGTRA